MKKMKLIHGGKRHCWKQAASCAFRLTLISLLVPVSAVFFLTTPVQAQPSIFPSPLADAQVGSPYNAALMASGGTAPYTWSIVTGALPPGLSLDSNTGAISGTPTTAGTFSFVARVTDQVPASADQGFFINVTSPPLTFTTSSLSVAKVGTPYGQSLGVTGGTLPYLFTIVSGNLPTGLQVASTGYISGTPASGTAGIHSFVIGVTDSSSPALSGQQSFNLTIEKGAFEPSVSIGSGLEAGETDVSVGGETLATLRGGESINLSFDLGTSQTISVDPVVDHPSEEDVRFKAEVDRIRVSELSPNAHFPYYAEYFIDLETDPPNLVSLTGSGWYKEDYTLRVSAPEEVDVEDEPGTRYRFSYWWLPNGDTVSQEDLGFTVSEPGSCIANYDTYYLLTLTSPYGEAEGTAWYKAGSQAEWDMASHEVRMSGILGFFGGKLKALKYSGTKTMDGPATVTVEWEPDYTMPAILIPLAILLLVLGSYGLYRLWRGPQPMPVPMAPPLQAMPPPQTTVVMIGDKQKQAPETTKDRLIEQFSQLLEKYEQEITSSTGTKAAQAPPRIETVPEERGLPAPQQAPPPIVDGEIVPEEEEGAPCDFTAKKLLRVVVSNWGQIETRTADLPAGDEKTAEGGLAIVWARNVYQEWEILTCSLPHGHEEPHEGSRHKAFSLLNTVTEEQVYSPGVEPKPPEPHYTDGMPRAKIPADQVVSSDQLPHETLS